MRPPVATGGSCLRPRLAIEPHQACRVNSVAARSDHGPVPPNHEIDTTTSSGSCPPQLLDVAAEPVADLAGMTGDHDVGVAHEAVERVAVVATRGIERRAPFRGVQHGEQRRLVAERVAVGCLPP